jgi:hypothetical protein
MNLFNRIRDTEYQPNIVDRTSHTFLSNSNINAMQSNDKEMMTSSNKYVETGKNLTSFKSELNDIGESSTI